MADKKLESLYRESDELTPRDGLKKDILARAQQELSLKNRESARVNERRRAPKSGFRRWIAVVACFLFVCLLGGGFWGVYQQDYHTVYIDVNPSVVLEVNLFGKVNDVEYLNEDASEALEGVKLKGKSAEDALEKVIDAYDKAGYFEENAELFISAVSKKSKKADKLLAKLEKRAEKAKGDKKYTVNTAKLTKEEKELAKEQGISGGKYKLIKEIMALDSTYTVDDLKDGDMKELKDLKECLKEKYKLIEKIMEIDPSYTVEDLKDKTVEELETLKECLKEKYKLIEKIMELDPSYTVEDLKDKTVEELETLKKSLKDK